METKLIGLLYDMARRHGTLHSGPRELYVAKGPHQEVFEELERAGLARREEINGLVVYALDDAARAALKA